MDMFSRVLRPVFLALLAIIGSLPLPAHASEVQAGLTWLGMQQKPSGAVENDATLSTDWQATAQALQVLKVDPPDTAFNEQAAEDFLTDNLVTNTEYLARALLAGIQNDAQGHSLKILLRSHQNSDGGFGDAMGYESTPLDTAWALRALAQVDASTSANGPALAYLISKQHTDGSWSFNGNSSSPYITALALDALTSFRSLFDVATPVGSAQTYLLSTRSATTQLWEEHFVSAQILLALVNSLSEFNGIADSISALRSAQSANGSWNDDPFSTSLALQALIQAASPPGGGGLSRIEGQILSAQTGYPLNGVRVTLTGANNVQRITAADGTFAFADLLPGDNSFAIELPDYRTINITTRTTAGKVANLGTLQLLPAANPASGALFGTVLDASDGEPLAGVSIAVGGVAQQAITGADGKYQITGIEPGTRVVAITKAGYSTATGTANVAAGSFIVFSPSIRPVAQQTTAITGTITDAVTAAPMSGVEVTLSGGASGTTITASDGTYTLSGLTAGSAILAISHPGFDSVTTPVTIYTNNVIDISVGLYAAGETPANTNVSGLAGTVVDSVTGLPLSGAGVLAYFGSEYSTSTDGTGAFTLTGFDTAEGTIVITKSGYQTLTLATSIPPLTVASLGEIRLHPLAVSELLPDLSISSIDFSGISTNPQTLAMSGQLLVNVTNAGTAATQAGFNAAVFYDVDKDDNYDPAVDIFLGEATQLDSLAVGGSSQLAIVVGGFVPYRDALIKVLADSQNVLAELAETNNTLASSESLPDLSVSTLVPVIQPTGGLALTVQVANGRGPNTGTGIKIGFYEGDSGVGGRLLGEVTLDPLAGDSVRTITFNNAILNGGLPLYVTVDKAGLVSESKETNNTIQIAAPDLKADLTITAVGHANLITDLQSLAVSGSLDVEVRNLGSLTAPAGVTLQAFNDANYNELLDSGEVVLGTVTVNTPFTVGQTTTIALPVAGDVDFRDAPISVWVDSGKFVGELKEDNNVLDTTCDCAVFPPPPEPATPIVTQPGYVARLVAANVTNQQGPVALAHDSFGNLYIAYGDAGSGVVRAGTNVAVPFTSTPGDSDGIAIDRLGNIVVSGTTIVKFAPNASALWSRSCPIGNEQRTAIDSNGYVYVGSLGTSMCKIAPDNSSFQVFGGYNRPSDPFFGPDGTLYVNQPGPNTILKLNKDTGAIIETFVSGLGTLALPQFDSNGDLVFGLGGSINHMKLPERTITQIATGFSAPNGITFSPEGELFVGDSTTKRIYAISKLQPNNVADLTASKVEVLDNGAGQPFTVKVRAGNAGLAVSPAVVLKLYSSDPQSGGTVIGSTSVGALDAGSYVDVTVQGVAIPQGVDRIYAVIDAEGTLAECLEDNNTASGMLPGALLSSIAVTTDLPQYGPQAAVDLRGTITNAAAVSGTYSVNLMVEDTAGVVIYDAPDQSTGALPSGGEVTLHAAWNTASLLAGDYVLRGQVLGPNGTVLAEATASFRVNAAGGSGVQLRSTTDKQTYSSGEEVQIASLVQNLTENGVLTGASVRILVRDSLGATLLDTELPVLELASGSQAELETSLQLSPSAAGQFEVESVLMDANDVPLALDEDVFTVEHNPLLFITGTMEVEFSIIDSGMAQTCSYALTNGGEVSIADVAAQFLLVSVDDQTVEYTANFMVSLAADETKSYTSQLNTESLSRGSYACVLEIQAGSTWQQLAYDDFQANNNRPVADAGADQLVFIGDLVALDGSGSTDLDSDPLTYLWSIESAPLDSTAMLTGADTALPTIQIDKHGNYRIRLVVNDGLSDSLADVVELNVGNIKPVAKAGLDQTGFIGTEVTLDGSQSFDVDGDGLTYSWSFASRPAGSTATLLNPGTINPTFTIDAHGVYEVELIVHDGIDSSAPARVTVNTLNLKPVADPGADLSVYVGNVVTLDGSDSYDGDGDALSYQWSLLNKPAGSTASLSNAATVSPSLGIDVPGSYIIQLIVFDGLESSDPQTVVLTTFNVRPVAEAGSDQLIEVGEAVVLNGTNSYDADNDTLAWQWSLLSKPAGSTAALTDSATATPGLVADEEGIYIAQLIVSDGELLSAPDTVKLTAVSLEPELECSAAFAYPNVLWPPNNKMSAIHVEGLGASIAINYLGITQDEMIGTGKHSPDAEVRLDTDGVSELLYLRSEREGNLKNGRVYRILFEAASTQGGQCTGSVRVVVPHDQSHPVVDDGQLYNSLGN